MSVPRALRSFAVVGAIGFAIEAVLLTALTQLAHWTPWQARIPSFLTAVLATWLLNRTHTFAGRGHEQRSVEAVLYLAIQTCGVGINLLLFGACLHYVPATQSLPVIALAVGSAGGFVFNFSVMHLFLYRART